MHTRWIAAACYDSRPYYWDPLSRKFGVSPSEWLENDDPSYSRNQTGKVGSSEPLGVNLNQQVAVPFSPPSEIIEELTICL